MIQPAGERLLIEPVKAAMETTDSGIILAGERVVQSIKAKVLAVGSDCKRGFKVDDVVFVSQFSPTEARESVTHSTLICSEDDVLGVVIPNKA